MSDFDQNSLDSLLNTAQAAAKKMQKLSSDQVERIVKAVVAAAAEKSEYYAQWAVRETGYGRVDDKHMKNMGVISPFLGGTADFGLYVRPRVDNENKIVEIPKPAGVITALVPVTNPIATVYYKAVCALLTRNAIILSPHPGSKESSTDVLNYLHDVAVRNGAPTGCMQVVQKPAVALTQALMQDERNNLTLATGGPDMVRAAYSSSNPAIGVGAANVACYVDRTADIVKAAKDIVFSAPFDNSLPCTCESVVVADMPIAAQFKQEMKNNSAYFVESAEERQKLRDFLYPEGKMNVKMIGKDAAVIAQQAGFSIPSSVRLLVMPISSIGYHEPFSKEKMFPVVGFFEVDGCEEAIQTALSMLNLMGKGHSAAIFANNPDVVIRFGAALPVCRIPVNTPACLGSSGTTTNIVNSPVIGTGFFGRSSVDSNVGPEQLVQWTRVAFGNEPAAAYSDMDSAVDKLIAEQNLNAVNNNASASSSSAEFSDPRNDLKELIREVLAEELRDILKK
ncbi:MAG: aldehyde dehydrogenase family protein [Pseudomonadales bacterium]